MKKTALFVTMLAAALLGGQVFADAVPTKVKGYSQKYGDLYIGADGDQSSGGEVFVSYSADGSDMSSVEVMGGRGGESTTGNTVIMTGGEVWTLCGGKSQKSATGNVVIVAGDSKVGMDVLGGNATGGSSRDNKVYLVGNGATATIADAQGKKAEYTGGKLSLRHVIAGGEGDTMSGNSVDIYGTGIDVRDLRMMQVLNFHIANLDDGATPMITLPSWLFLTNFLVPTEDNPSPELALTFDALDSMEWKPGASVTLVNAGEGIKIDESLLGKEYNIYRNGDPDKTVLGTATLKLEQGEGTTKILKLVTNGNVPEPTTGTLSLLALAALTARRRK